MVSSAPVLGLLVGLLVWWSVPAAWGARDRRDSSAGARASSRLLFVAVALATVAWWLLAPRGLSGVVLMAGLALVGFGVRRVGAGTRSRRERARRRARVLEFCDALTAELHAGLPTSLALERACSDWAELAAVRSAARLGGDVARALRSASARPGARGLAAVAAAWDVAGRSGTALAGVLDRVTDGLRHEADAAAEVAAALGPPRATARMLMVLPALGVGLGMSMGAQPLRFLLTTGIGVTCLLGGAALAIAGVLWVERLAAAAED